MEHSRFAPKDLNGPPRPPTRSLPTGPAAANGFAEELKKRQEEAASQVALAMTAFKNGQYAVLDVALRRALELDPRNVPALQLLANMNLAQGRMAAVAAICSKILQQDKDNVDATVGLGVAFFHQSNKDMARKSLERALKLCPNHALALEHLQSLQLAEPSRGPLTAQSIILVNNLNYNACSAGIRALHYLAALLRAADIPVAVTHRCFYNPTIPVRGEALPDDIVVYPDASRGNSLGAKRICRYMLYFAHAYFGGDRIAKEECAIVFHRNYLADVQAHCDSPLTGDDIITVPILDKEWCFPEAKTVENVLYERKGQGQDPAETGFHGCGRGRRPAQPQRPLRRPLRAHEDAGRPAQSEELLHPGRAHVDVVRGRAVRLQGVFGQGCQQDRGTNRHPGKGPGASDVPGARRRPGAEVRGQNLSVL